MVSLSALAALAATVISGSHAHMIMKSPVPYGKDTLNNSPLDNSGSDFPCKQRSGVYDISEVNSMPVGVPQVLSFTGSATHGGGSCQLSVTLDQKPTKDSEWKVIHSIVGGCPSNAAGNLASNDDTTFNFTMPEGMPNGQYTLGWTWFNKVGNREIYQNCAPVHVTGGADNNDVYDKLPYMFIANLPREECEIPENENFDFPNPGDSVVTLESSSVGSSLSGSNCAAVTKLGEGAGTAGSVASATGGSGAAATSAVASTSPAYASPAKSTPANTGGVFAPGASSAAVQSSAQTSAAAVPVTTPAAMSTPATAATPAGTGSSSCVPCPTDGAVVCMGTSQFGLCNNGCAVPQAVAAGTSCSEGRIVRRDGRVLQRSHFRRVHDRALALARHQRHA